MGVGVACRSGLGPCAVSGLAVAVLALGLWVVPVNAAAAATWSTWSNVASSGPAGSSQAVEAYDQATSTDVLFTPSGQTWTWNGSTWTQQFPTISPPGRWAASMAYDPVHGQVVLFGGCNGTGCANNLSDTWTWNGSNWQEQSPVLSPPARTHGAMAWDPGSKTVLLFGGGTSTTNYGDTWSWNGSSWSLDNIGNAPTPRSGAMMAEDDSDGTVVLFGGEAPGGPLSDTWVWTDPQGWIKATPAVSPSGRLAGSFAYSPANNMAVLFGGNSGSYPGPVPLQDTWVWGDGEWTQVSPTGTPAARWESAISTGPSGSLVMFGGQGNSGPLGDTWSWTGMPLPGLVARSGSQVMLDGSPFRFAGTNTYWLALDGSGGTNTGGEYPSQFAVDDAFATMSEMGETVDRSWGAMSVGSPNSIEPTKGVFNQSALHALDLAIAEAGKYGIRLILPLVNNWSNGLAYGSTATFAQWEGDTNSSDFYTDPKVIADFEQYIREILTRLNSITGVPYADNPTILAWETGNEIGPPASWTNTIARYVKSLDPNHLVMDGTYGINDGTSYTGAPPAGVCGGDLGLSNVDIYSNHFYPMNTSLATGDADAVASCAKAFIIGEYAWNDDSVSTLPAFLSGTEGDAHIAGDLYWDLWPHNPSYGYDSPSSDQYQLHYPGQTADMATRAQELRTHAYSMSGLAVPAHTAVGTPVITDVTPTRQIEWRGVAGGDDYSVEESTQSSTGPWTVICNLCATDNSTPWQDPNPAEGTTIWYRVQADNLDGVVGPWSGPYKLVG
jgi:hypothetical protein